MKTSAKARLLVVDDNEDVLLAAQMLFERHDFEIDTERDPESVLFHLRKYQYDAILLDMNYTRDASSGREGFELLKKILAYDANAVVIPITAYGEVDLAVRCMKAGAIDFVEKPWKNEKILATVSTAVKLNQSRVEIANLRSRQERLVQDMDEPFNDFIGQSEAIKQVFAIINKVAATDANVLIMGENGSGKEVVAREIHRRSLRKDQVFLSVDLGAISETLFDSELFGHMKGSFTDAKNDRKGRFEVASQGSLFLDEIGNLSLPLQQKLLSALQSRLITPVGSNKQIPIDVRLICATNMPVQEMIENREFRQDLFYRVNTVEIHIPPLRDRLDDLPLLMEHFINSYSRKYKNPIRRASRTAMKCLQEYKWPGNVRELQHAVERAVIMSDGDVLEDKDFFLNPSYSQKDDSFDFESYNLEWIEKSVIEKVVKMRQGNISQAATDLGITRTSLYRRMQKHNL